MRKRLEEYERDENAEAPLAERLKDYVQSNYPKAEQSHEVKRLARDDFDTPTGQHRLDKLFEIIQTQTVDTLTDRVNAEKEARQLAEKRLAEIQSKREERIWQFAIGVLILLAASGLYLAIGAVAEYAHHSDSRPTHLDSPVHDPTETK